MLLNADKKPGEPLGRHRDVAVVANNGTRTYENLIANLEGCTANVRFDETRDDFNVMQVGGAGKRELPQGRESGGRGNREGSGQGGLEGGSGVTKPGCLHCARRFCFLRACFFCFLFFCPKRVAIQAMGEQESGFEQRQEENRRERKRK